MTTDQLDGILVKSPADPQGDAPFRVTAVTRLKHTELLAAAREKGSQRALAIHLGIDLQTVCKWINLRSMPVRRAGGSVGRWGRTRVDELEKKLLVLTGQTWDELFPPKLASNRQFMDAEKSSETTREFEHGCLLQYAARTTERLSGQHSGEDLRESVQSALTRLTERERDMVVKRFGIDGDPKTLKEIGTVYGITKERVRQVCDKAIEKLQRTSAGRETDDRN
jgi:RNA polymerase sigma factor (sigma-70 family)